MNSSNLNRVRVRHSLLVALGLILAPVASHADTLAQYTFGSGSASSADTDLNSVAGSFTLGSALVGASAGIDSITETAFAKSSVTGASEALAVSGGSYFSFTLTPEVGYELNLSTLTFQTVYDGSLSSGVLTANYAVRSSLDGFSANIASFSQVYAPSSSSSFVLREVDLSSGSSYQSIVGTIEFRIYLSDNSTSADRSARVDNVIVSGATLAIPEPSTFAAFLGCAALVAGVASRRRG